VSEGDTGHVPPELPPTSDEAREATESKEPPEPTQSEQPRRREGRWLRRTTSVLVILVLVAAVAAYRFDLGSRWLGHHPPSPVTEPALVLPPAGLALPAMPRAAAVAPRTVEGAVDGAAVRRTGESVLLGGGVPVGEIRALV